VRAAGLAAALVLVGGCAERASVPPPTVEIAPPGSAASPIASASVERRCARSGSPLAEGVVRDAGAADPGAARALPDAPAVGCPCGEPACRFEGVVRSVRPAVRPVGTGRVQPGVRIVLGDAGAPTCTRSAFGDTAAPVAPTVNELFVALPEGVAQPVRTGERVCGFARGFARGREPGHEGLVARLDGTPIIAFADEHALPPSPLPGWEIAIAALSWNQPHDEGYGWYVYAMTVRHAGEEGTVSDDHSTTLRARDGHYTIGAHGYQTDGTLPPDMRWAEQGGYAFWIVRDGDP